MSSNSSTTPAPDSHDETLMLLLQAYQSAGWTEDEAYDKTMEYEDQAARDWGDKGKGGSKSRWGWGKSK